MTKKLVVVWVTRQMVYMISCLKELTGLLCFTGQSYI